MHDYRQILDRILTEGEYSSPRGLSTLDLGYTTIAFHKPEHMLIRGNGRGLSAKIAAVEAIQLIGGFHDADLMNWASPNFKQFMDDGWFWGAYGSRIGHQMEAVANKIMADRETRQAVVTLWNPQFDNIEGKHDYPCTVSLGYRIRAGSLDAWTFMRSNDAWLGLPYDVFQFTQLQRTLARSLGVPSGTYTHTAASLHVYVDNIDQINKITHGGIGLWEPDGIGDGIETMRTISQRARMIGQWPGDLKENLMTESEKWYVRILDPFHADVPKAELG
jgi:thymidylate synthase